MRRFLTKLSILSLAVLLILTASAPAPAQRPGGGGMGGMGGRNQLFRGARRGRFNNQFPFFGDAGGSTLFDLYRSGDIPVPPYFALHPPVYYSHNVSQPYGASPFAYPYTWWQQFGYPSANLPSPYAMAYPSEPAVIENPYIPSPALPVEEAEPTERSDTAVEAETVDDVASAEPLLIINPYVSTIEPGDGEQFALDQ